jgi:mono/diheme cytochrome c family protein
VNAPSTSKGVGKFTHVTIGALDPKLADQGKQLFETKCTACHKPTDERLVGPGLKGITKIRTPEWIMNMMTNPTGMTHQDPVAEALLAQYQTQMTYQDVSDKDARAIYEFLRQNDAQ